MLLIGAWLVFGDSFARVPRSRPRPGEKDVVIPGRRIESRAYRLIGRKFGSQWARCLAKQPGRCHPALLYASGLGQAEIQSTGYGHPDAYLSQQKSRRGINEFIEASRMPG